MHLAFCKHCVVLQFRLSERRSVGGDQNELGLPRSQCLNCRLEAERVLVRLHNQRKSRVDILCRLLLGLDHFSYKACAYCSAVENGGDSQNWRGLPSLRENR